VSIQNALRNIRLIAGKHPVCGRDATRLSPYYAGATQQFNDRNMQYASDFFAGNLQGLVDSDFYEFSPVQLRLTDASSPTPTGKTLTDDYKMILVKSCAKNRLRLGAKLETAENTWIVVNPQNISSVTMTGLVQRCNATWNHLDFYGNVLKEPICVESEMLKASAPDFQDYILATKGYVDITCQLNEYTTELTNNSRIILGTSAYALTGVTDFLQEKTGDDDSIHILRFSSRYEEPNTDIDDMENRVAGGKVFDWTIQINGVESLKAGNHITFTANSYRNGDAVSSTQEHPVSYEWKSSDESIATVSAQGVVAAIAEGTAAITCSLKQNPAKSATMNVSVENTGSGYSVGWTATPPKQIGVYDSCELTAAVYLDGVETAESVMFTTSNADIMSYTAEKGNNIIDISCWQGSVKPLIVTATAHGESVSATIELIGM